MWRPRLKSNPKITVYIPSHNYGHYLKDAVESVLKQTVENWELLLINDDSSDDSQEVMDLYKGDERIHVFSTNGIGLPAVGNLALKKAKGDYLIRLDGDDVFDENILLVLGHYLDKYPEYAMVFPDYYLIDDQGEIYSHERREKVYINNHILDMPANGACCLICTNILQELGGYREDLGAQDGFDLWRKITEKYKVMNINLPLFYYRRHNQNLTNMSQRIISARRQIKHDTIVKDKINDYRPIIAVIPCRKNYDFAPDVWKMKIQGKSLLQLNIEKCVRSKLIDNIIVASDNPEVQEIMSLVKDSRLTFFQRSLEDTIISQSLTITLEKILSQLDPDCKGITILSYLQTPLVATSTLEEAVLTLIINDVDCVFGVEAVRDPLYKRSANGLKPINPPRGVSSDFDIVYRETNTSLASRSYNIKNGSLTGSKVINIIVHSEENFFIKSEHTLKIANIIAQDR